MVVVFHAIKELGSNVIQIVRHACLAMLYTDFELLADWQIVKDRRYPIGFN